MSMNRRALAGGGARGHEAGMTAPHDVIIVGSGAAGLTAALALADTLKVLVLAKGSVVAPFIYTLF